MPHSSIPITIFTGFLGSGKTTIINQIIDTVGDNGSRVFGVIVNEFGEVGIDNEILHTQEDEIVELSNGCMCCIVRSDLYNATEKLLQENPRINYLIIEASGLAEPKPIADTYVMNTLDGKVHLDAICCVVDAENHRFTQDHYKVALEQIQYSDIIILNKITQDTPQEDIAQLTNTLLAINKAAVIVQNSEQHPIHPSLLIDQQVWNQEKLESLSDEDHSHHHVHEHESFEEYVYISPKQSVFSPDLLDDWLKNRFPSSCIRAKGIISIQTPKGAHMYLFQMVGASKMLTPFEPTHQGEPIQSSRMVFIGQSLQASRIAADLNNCIL